jgi:hypothetical protein
MDFLQIPLSIDCARSRRNNVQDDGRLPSRFSGSKNGAPGKQGLPAGICADLCGATGLPAAGRAPGQRPVLGATGQSRVTSGLATNRPEPRNRVSLNTESIITGSAANLAKSSAIALLVGGLPFSLALLHLGTDIADSATLCSSPCLDKSVGGASSHAFLSKRLRICVAPGA